MRSPFTARRRGGTRADATQCDVDPLMLASVSHEIRTPMNSLIGMLELLSLTSLTAEQHHLLRIARDSARSLVRVADDVLDMSKIRAGRVELEMVPVDVRRLIEDLIALLRAENAKSDVRIEADIDTRLSRPISTDPTRLRQVLMNIAGNALKFTHAGSVTIRARLLEEFDAAQRFRISIADTGIGMSRESLKRVWEPFAQARASTARFYGGTGLGLTIARQLASRLGGRLSMRSRLGKGTTAYLEMTLPIVVAAVDDSESAGDRRQDDASAGRGGLSERLSSGRIAGTPRHASPLANGMKAAPRSRFRILIADDDPTSRLMIEMQLTQLGYSFDGADDGTSALERLRHRHYDLLLTDLRMPALDGRALASRWRELEASGALPMPVIGLTANPLVSPPHPKQELMNDCLIKPISLKQLEAALDNWLVGSCSLATGWQAKAITAVRDRKIVGPTFNFDRLERSFGGAVTLGEVAATFVRTTQADLAALLPYVDGTGDASPLHRSCSMRLHRITGGLQVMGQHRLAQTGAALETALIRAATDRYHPDEQQALRVAIESFGVEVTCHLDWLARQWPR